jgi:hypothetical protein
MALDTRKAGAALDHEFVFELQRKKRIAAKIIGFVALPIRF